MGVITGDEDLQTPPPLVCHLILVREDGTRPDEALCGNRGGAFALVRRGERVRGLPPDVVYCPACFALTY